MRSECTSFGAKVPPQGTPLASHFVLDLTDSIALPFGYHLLGIPIYGTLPTRGKSQDRWLEVRAVRPSVGAKADDNSAYHLPEV